MPAHLLSSRTQLWNLFPLALPFRQAFFLLRSARAERCPKISSMPKYSIFNDRSALAERKSKLPLRIMEAPFMVIPIYNNVWKKSSFWKRKKKYVTEHICNTTCYVISCNFSEKKFAPSLAGLAKSRTFATAFGKQRKRQEKEFIERLWINKQEM